MGKEKNGKKEEPGASGLGPGQGEPHVSYHRVFIYPVVNREALKGFNQEQT